MQYIIAKWSGENGTCFDLVQITTALKGPMEEKTDRIKEDSVGREVKMESHDLDKTRRAPCGNDPIWLFF